jgi:hypothetical protein
MIRSCAVALGVLVAWVLGFIFIVPFLANALYDRSPLKGTGDPFNADALTSFGLAVAIYVIASGIAAAVLVWSYRRTR